MKPLDSRLVTPIHAKTSTEPAWPAGEQAFYVLAGNGLFFCRDHPFFRSCVLARGWPSELERQDEFLEPRYPKIGKKALEEIVGFFDRISALHSAEAAVLLAWSRSEHRVKVIVPRQTATVGETLRGARYPVGLRYEGGADLPPDLLLFGDVHSHVYEAAYASSTDKRDEAYRAGLHIVVGRLDREPPEFHVEAVADGVRFPLDPSGVFGGYERRRERFPVEWLARVDVEVKSFCSTFVYSATDRGDSDSSRRTTEGGST